MEDLVSDSPAVRACIFDLDGLLINSEDVITLCVDQLLQKYGRPVFTRSIRAQLMGLRDSTSGDTFHNWAKLPIPRGQFIRELAESKKQAFPGCKPLPGAKKLLSDLSRASNAAREKIELALASSTKRSSYELKTSNPDVKELLSFFQSERIVTGDDPRLPRERGKPAPDIYHIALQSLNSTANLGGKYITPSECLAFEDSVAGVEAASRAGMRVVWVPHPDVALEYQSREEDILAGRSGMFDIGEDWQVAQTGNDRAESIRSLEEFDYEKYGISVRS